MDYNIEYIKTCSSQNMEYDMCDMSISVSTKEEIVAMWHLMDRLLLYLEDW